ncbi:MAG: hypothetical protein RIC35_15350 [Marinoscillum sp.]
MSSESPSSKAGGINYIHHLNNWFAKIQEDARINPTHISLYLALFQLWNMNRFRNPLSVARVEVMQLSKIGSANTYSKCMKDLHNWNYIHYQPSHNPLRGSTVNMFSFDMSSDTTSDKSSERALRPYINSTKQVKQSNTHVNQNKDFNEPL